MSQHSFKSAARQQQSILAPLEKRTLIWLAHRMVAAGTTPNITYEKEHSGTFQLDSKKKFFAPYRVKRNGNGGFALEAATAADAGAFFTSYTKDGRFITYYGDNHPRYAGNVVKAMGLMRISG